MIVDLTIENNPDGSVFIADGLMAGGQVDDAEAAHAEANHALGEDAVVVGTAVDNRVAHAAHGGGIRARVGAELEYARDSTHAVCLRPAPAQNPGLGHGIKKSKFTGHGAFRQIARGRECLGNARKLPPFETFDW